MAMVFYEGRTYWRQAYQGAVGPTHLHGSWRESKDNPTTHSMSRKPCGLCLKTLDIRNEIPVFLQTEMHASKHGPSLGFQVASGMMKREGNKHWSNPCHQGPFFFPFFFLKVCISIFDCAGSFLLRGPFSSCGEWRVLSGCRALAQ